MSDHQHVEHILGTGKAHDDSSHDRKHNSSSGATQSAGNKKSLSDSLCSITIAPLVHETQCLQLCAIHALNNLLQLAVHDQHDNATKNIDLNQQIILSCGMLFRHATMEAGSKGEFDSIADNFTHKEALLYQHDCAVDIDTVETNECTQSVSFRQVLTSRHRTPIFGNYSFEVLEAALLKRNVKLEWCSEIDSLIDRSIRRVELDSGQCEVSIGFIVNTIEPLSIWNAFARPFTGSRHWYAITNLRRVVNHKVKQKTDNCIGMTIYMKGENNQFPVDNCHVWHLIDSESRKVIDLNQVQLKELLYDILQNGGSVMRATMTKLSPFN